jgi:hypothetical protein
MQQESQLHLVIPIGTKVLTRTLGRVGVVTHTPATPEHTYRVRFADGPEESFARGDLTIFKHVQAEVPGAPDPAQLYRFVIYRCVVGSTAYGLDRDGSDVDRRGCVKPLLYVYRVILTGIFLMRTGRIEANLVKLNDEFHLPYIPDLVARKVTGSEKGTLDAAELGFHKDEYHRLIAQLESAAALTKLPPEPTCRHGLNDLLIGIRLR